MFLECKKFIIDEDKYKKCFVDILKSNINKIKEEKEEIKYYRDNMSSKLHDYTCADPTLNTSEPISYSYFKMNNNSYDVDMLFNSTSAKIWIIHNFVSDDECEYLENYAKPLLEKSIVYNFGEGIDDISEYRTSKQAGYVLQGGENDPLWYNIQYAILN